LNKIPGREVFLVRKIAVQVPDDQLKADLERYRMRAIELGAVDAKVITMDQVVIDDRVSAKCAYPKCGYYGSNANCPPHAMPIDQFRKVAERFTYAVFIKLQVPSGEIAGRKALKENLALPSRKKLAEIVSRIESEAFYDGHHLALGFSGGACKSIFCPDNDCIALQPAKACPHRLRARSSMEAVGMDVYTMAASVGWDIYPLGLHSSPEEVPHGLRLGIVFIR